MIILAIETSCDETSVAVVKDGNEVLSNVVFSQISIHQEYGGVVPEIAARNHIKYITTVIDEALKISGIKPSDLAYVAVTKGPGLIGALLIGINAAQAFALAHGLQIIEVNHLLGHIYSANLENKITFPSVVLLISGGHTMLLYATKELDFKMIGETQDDAVGEAYDKVARLLGLSYPGGPEIDKRAFLGKESYVLPRPMIDDKTFNFSFSGLKSATLNLINQKRMKKEEVNINDLCTSFQNSVLDILLSKTLKALSQYNSKTLVVAGGVSANHGLRERLSKLTDINVIIPSLKYSTDNAAMIGAAAFILEKHGQIRDDYLVQGESVLDLF